MKSFIKYIKGFRKGKDAHRIELEAMFDPFLEEAIEGYNMIKGDHIGGINKMQGKIARYGKYRSRRIWLSVASVAAIALFVGYFSVFDKSSVNDYNETENLYVYLPEEYVHRAQMASDITVSPVVEIDNIEILQPDEMEIYLPDEYLQKKQVQSKAATIIVNLDEIEPITIYLPEKSNQNL